MFKFLVILYIIKLSAQINIYKLDKYNKTKLALNSSQNFKAMV